MKWRDFGVSLGTGLLSWLTWYGVWWLGGDVLGNGWWEMPGLPEPSLFRTEVARVQGCPVPAELRTEVCSWWMGDAGGAAGCQLPLQEIPGVQLPRCQLPGFLKSCTGWREPGRQESFSCWEAAESSQPHLQTVIDALCKGSGSAQSPFTAADRKPPHFPLIFLICEHGLLLLTRILTAGLPLWALQISFLQELLLVFWGFLKVGIFLKGWELEVTRSLNSLPSPESFCKETLVCYSCFARYQPHTCGRDVKFFARTFVLQW